MQALFFFCAIEAVSPRQLFLFLVAVRPIVHRKQQVLLTTYDSPELGNGGEQKKNMLLATCLPDKALSFPFLLFNYYGCLPPLRPPKKCSRWHQQKSILFFFFLTFFKAIPQFVILATGVYCSPHWQVRLGPSIGWTWVFSLLPLLSPLAAVVVS